MLLGIGCGADSLDLADPIADDASNDDLGGVLARSGDAARSSEVDDFIDGLGHLTLPPEQAPTPIECQGEGCLTDDGLCTYSYYHTTEYFQEVVAFVPGSAVLWPGALVEGAAASAGQLHAIALPRAPLTFSLSLENLAASPVGTMEKPSLSAFRATRNQILAEGVTGKTPAMMDFSRSEVRAASDVSLGLKFDVDWPGGSEVAGMFDFKTESTSTKLLVDFTQAYYTIDVDVPGRPSDLFAPEVTVDDLARSMGEGNPPMYVQSITFGRRAVLSVESDRTSEEVTAALDLTLNALIDASLQLDMHTKSVIDSLEMKVFVLGGAGEAGVKSIEGFDGLVKYIQEGADYSASSPGAPIAYKLAYLDNTAAEFAYTTDYAEAKCLSEVTLRVRADSLAFPGNGEGKGQGEMTWGVWAKSGAQSCELSRQDGKVKISDGEAVTIQNSCDFTFRLEENPSIQIGLWATEHGGFLDSSKTAGSSRSYTFDAKVGQWNPDLGGSSLNASKGNLTATLNYSVDLL
ncbi:thiol-activated cytolysin family protein [Nannocystis sp. ILAH1]|uniref:thiol-activated cytolysin family protein n=1 Tax=Nannocystis sp. ILAH1 TaxID=2996789 RepID=UPI00226D725B|nr:thiol-activated cytolysin family protein [Nannocystis sp. ILAH1]MCY0987203.1 thiol-activated cytolysin family protein [Nannocystis sp. ILAH1]